MYYGYHRVSSKQQNLERGINEIEKYCREQKINLKKLYTDKSTGCSFSREQYQIMKENALRSGDVLIITEIDRLGRNKEQILQELKHFKEINVRVMILELPTTLQKLDNTDGNISKIVLDTINNILIEVFAAMAQAELEKREKRQREGIEAMKKRGDWELYGRPRILPFELFEKEYKKVKNGTLKPFELKNKLGLTTSTFYRYKKEYDNLHIHEN